MFLKFIHAIMLVISSFFIMLDSFMLYEYTLFLFVCFLMLSSNDGHLDDFQLLALMNTYSINTSVFVDVLYFYFVLR